MVWDTVWYVLNSYAKSKGFRKINQSAINQSRIVEPGMMILTVLSQYRYFLNAGTQFVCEKEGL